MKKTIAMALLDNTSGLELGLGKDHSVMAQIKAKTSTRIELWMLVNTYVLPSILLVNSLQ